MLPTLAQQSRHISNTASMAQNLISDVLLEIFTYKEVVINGISAKYVSHGGLLHFQVLVHTYGPDFHRQLTDEDLNFRILISVIQCWLLRSGDANISMKAEWARKWVAFLKRQLDVVLAEFAQCVQCFEKIVFVLPETSCSIALS